MKKRGEEKKKRRKRGRREERYGNYDFGMDYWTFGLIDFCMEKLNHKPFFFYDFGSKRTLLGILVVFGSFRLDLELSWFGFAIDLGLYGN